MKFDIVQSRSGDYMGPLRNNLIFCWPSIEAAVSETAHDRYNVLIFVVADKYSPPIAPHPLMVYTNFSLGFFWTCQSVALWPGWMIFRCSFICIILLHDLLIIHYTSGEAYVTYNNNCMQMGVGVNVGQRFLLLGLHFA